MLPLLDAANSTFIQAVSDIIGQGMGSAFGSPVIIGLFAIAFFIALMYVLRFSLDIAIVIVSILAYALIGAPGLPVKYPSLPPWLIFVPLGITAAVLVYAFGKMFRR